MYMRKKLSIILLIIVVSVVNWASADTNEDILFSDDPWSWTKEAVENAETITQKKESKAGKNAVVLTYTDPNSLQVQYYFVEDKLISIVLSGSYGNGIERERRKSAAIRNFNLWPGSGMVDIDSKTVVAMIDEFYDFYSIPHDKSLSNYKESNGVWFGKNLTIILLMDKNGNAKIFFNSIPGLDAVSESETQPNTAVNSFRFDGIYYYSYVGVDGATCYDCIRLYEDGRAVAVVFANNLPKAGVLYDNGKFNSGTYIIDDSKIVINIYDSDGDLIEYTGFLDNGKLYLDEYNSYSNQKYEGREYIFMLYQ